MFGLFLMCSLSQAQMVVLEPQNRLTAGVTYTEGSIGATLGFDSRLSQLIFINIGGFRGLTNVDAEPIEGEPKSYVQLQHGLWAAPGIRFPHRYKKDAINWDVIVRGGFGCLFADATGGDDWLLMEPAGLAGVDFLLRKDEYGLRFTTKSFVSNPYIADLNEKALIVHQQQSVELFYQW